MATPEQQAIIALQNEVKTTRDQVMEVTRRFDALLGAHTALRNQSDALFQAKTVEISALEARLTNLLTKQKTDFELLDLKAMKPEKFKGTRSEPWKPWARRFKAYCNGKSLGFRAALDWAEAQGQEITHLQGSSCPWEKAEYADEKLHDFLCATLAGDAVLLVDTPGLETRGFECWRLLCAKYSPNGGQHELDALMALLAPKPARDLAALGGAISRFEHDWRQYEKLTGESLPEKLKIGSLLKILPPAQASEIKWQMAKGLTNYSGMVEHIESYSAHIRHDGAYARGDNDMDVSSMGTEEYLKHAPPEEQAAYWQGVAAGYDPTGPYPPDDIAQDQPLDAMFKKGKGKGRTAKAAGKGHGGQATARDKGTGKGYGDTKPVDKSLLCDHCLIRGHLEKDCRGKAAGKPRRARDANGKPIRSLEQAQEQLDSLHSSGWERESQDQPLGTLDRDLKCLDLDCNPLSDELDFKLDAEEMWTAEVPEHEEQEVGGIQASTSFQALFRR